MTTLLKPDLHALLRPPYTLLILGVILFSVAVVSTCTGKAWLRFYGWAYRTENPTDFWYVVAVYFLGGVVVTGIFMYELYRLSH